MIRCGYDIVTNMELPGNLLVLHGGLVIGVLTESQWSVYLMGCNGVPSPLWCHIMAGPKEQLSAGLISSLPSVAHLMVSLPTLGVLPLCDSALWPVLSFRGIKVSLDKLSTAVSGSLLIHFQVCMIFPGDSRGTQAHPLL